MVLPSFSNRNDQEIEQESVKKRSLQMYAQKVVQTRSRNRFFNELMRKSTENAPPRPPKIDNKSIIVRVVSLAWPANVPGPPRNPKMLQKGAKNTAPRVPKTLKKAGRGIEIVHVFRQRSPTKLQRVSSKLRRATLNHCRPGSYQTPRDEKHFWDGR